MAEPYDQLIHRIKDIGRLGSIGQLLDWDQEVLMPERGVEARAEQVALIAAWQHEQLVADETRDLLDQAAPGDDVVRQTNIRETRRAHERAVRIPTELVKEIARASTIAKSAWAKARANDDFNAFAPHLENLIGLKRRVADCIGFDGGEPYDALMDEFEPGARSADIAALFQRLGDVTSRLLRRVGESAHKPDASIVTRHFSRERQQVLSRRMAEAVGYDFDAGRADVSVHPFCTTIGGSGDVRITTRYQEDFLPSSLFGTLHEAGHALYEQGLAFEHRFTPMAEAVSLGIHESQSRMWENFVGRSRAFWTFHWGPLQELFPEALSGESLEGFYRAINRAAPTFIRVEADELTYNLHIILRFDIERALISGNAGVADVPALWNRKFKELLGIEPPTSREGCLQDIHWSLGAFGYFPTYALGNLYAAQFFEKAEKDLTGLHEHIARNNHRPLLDWLRTHIHRHGQRFRADELVERVTGKPLSAEPFERYITAKLSDVYEW